LRELSQEIRNPDPRLPERDELGRWRSLDSPYLAGSGTRCQPGQDTYARYKRFAAIPWDRLARSYSKVVVKP